MFVHSVVCFFLLLAAMELAELHGFNVTLQELYALFKPEHSFKPVISYMDVGSHVLDVYKENTHRTAWQTTKHLDENRLARFASRSRSAIWMNRS